MNTTVLRTALAPRRPPRAARATLQALARLRHGTLTLLLPDGTVRTFGHGEPHATASVHRWDVFRQILSKGDVGIAECYAAGQWSTPHLANLLALVLRNRRELEAVVYGSWLGRAVDRIAHLLRRNTKAGSRRNIAAHYDLGNDFYRLWLDGTWNYSSALYGDDPAQSMESAQHAKMRRALQAAGVSHGSRVLEIGCGWGAVAEMAATEFGAEVTGVTLSREQLDFATRRLSLSAPGRATFRYQDYRDIDDGPFDAICSIEMVEAVGREYWPRYFAQVARLLKPGGRACIQAIVIDDSLWRRYIRGTDFIQQYIFPGGCLPCPSEFERHARAAGLEVAERFAFGRDYAITLRRWRERFLARRTEVQALGFDERFIRLWDFYLAYCEAAFDQCNTDVIQYTLRKPL